MYTLQIAFQSLFRLNPNKNRLVDCFLLQPGHNSITQQPHLQPKCAVAEY